MTARKPANSNRSQDITDDVPTSQAGATFSRNVSAIELAPLAKLRYRQPGASHTALAGMTPVQNETTLAEDGTGNHEAARAPEWTEVEVETVEEDEDTGVLSIPLAQRASVLLGQASSLGTQVSSAGLM